METNTCSTLAVKFWATIETPPQNNRENFRQGVIDTIINVLRLQDITIEYIGYKPDIGTAQHRSADKNVYEDCVFVSMNMPTLPAQPAVEKQNRIIEDFIRVFEDKTHKHLEIEASVVNNSKNQRVIEMTSDWKYHLKQG